MLLRVLKRQQMEQAIGYARYIIWATGQGASSLRGDPQIPCLSQSSSFYIMMMTSRYGSLPTRGKDPLDLLVLEACFVQDDRDVTPRLPLGDTLFRPEKLWDRWGQTHDTGEEDSNDDQSYNDKISIDEEDNGNDSHIGDEETSRKALLPNHPREGIINLVSFFVQCAFHSISCYKLYS